MHLETIHTRPMFFGRELKHKKEVRILRADSGEVWMTDCAQERSQMGSAVRFVTPGSRVLTAGLGLGIFVRMALARGVAQVVVVEKDPEIIAVVGPEFAEAVQAGRMEIVLGDVREFMEFEAKGDTVRFDFAYIDIWGSPSDFDYVDRLYCQKLAAAVSDKALCWALRGQTRSLRKMLREAKAAMLEHPELEEPEKRQRLVMKCAWDANLLFGLFLRPEWKLRVNAFMQWLRDEPEAAHEQMLTLYAEALDYGAKEQRKTFPALGYKLERLQQKVGAVR